MIQFNLLPDVKLEYVKALRAKNAVISGAVIATAISFLIFALMFIAVHVVQRNIMSGQTADIKKYTSELKNTPNLDKVLTVQSQLASLPGLHAAKPVASRTFSFIQQMTPQNVSLTDVKVDFAVHAMEVSGTAPKIDNINTFVDTVKFVTYVKTGSETSASKAFSDVVLSSLTRSDTSTSFTVKFTYDPAVYDNAAEISLKIPSGYSTSSVLAQPMFTKTITEDKGRN